MNRTELQGRVEAAVGRAWADFAQDHPALAQAIDVGRLVEQATDRLEVDPAFQAALADAIAADATWSTLASLFDRHVRPVVGRFVNV
jgi:hypothetical protein